MTPADEQHARRGGSGSREARDGGREGRGGPRGTRRGPDRRKPATPAGPRTEVQPARRVALEVITAVRADDAYANLLLPSRITAAQLGPADAGLATELTYGTLRMRGYYDRVLELAAGRPVTEIDGPVLDVLELGTHQLLSMRVATHAAVNESVELARTVSSRSATGFVNGVLRTITRSTPDQWRERVLATATDDDERLAVAGSHPAWVVRAFRRALLADGIPSAGPASDGEPATVRADAAPATVRAAKEGETAGGPGERVEFDLAGELDALIEADNTPAALSLAALPGLIERDEVGDGTEPAALSPIGLRAPGGDPSGIAAVRAGTARVQDEGSQLAALVLTRAEPVREGEHWLDLCAGPGGKTAVLAAEARLGGATVVANEPVPARAGLVRRAVAALPEPPEVWERDGTGLGDTERERFDRILVDAPCTGLGALRRRPEARWRKAPGDVAELVALQQRLIDSAVLALKPGGLLAYVTCSPHVAETRGQVQGALRRWPDELEQLDAQQILRTLTDDAITLGAPDLAAQLWPHRTATDAMFIALFRKH